MHELHCSKLKPRDAVESTGACAAASGTTTASKGATSATVKPAVKIDKIKKNPIESAETEDFDELLDMFTKSNNVCNLYLYQCYVLSYRILYRLKLFKFCD